MHSNAQGHVGDFAFVATGDGYRWEIPLGAATIRYVATVRDDELHEVGDRIVEGREPLRIFEMRLEADRRHRLARGRRGRPEIASP